MFKDFFSVAIATTTLILCSKPLLAQSRLVESKKNIENNEMFLRSQNNINSSFLPASKCPGQCPGQSFPDEKISALVARERGTLYRSRNNEAPKLYTQLTKIKSDKYKKWLSRGFALFKLGQYEKAISSFKLSMCFSAIYLLS